MFWQLFMGTKKKGFTQRFTFTAMQISYWISNSIIFTFSSIYLLECGFTNGQIGAILTIACTIGLVLQSGVGAAADRSKRLRIIDFTILLMVFYLANAASMLTATRRASLLLAAQFVVALAVIQAIEPLINTMGVAIINDDIPLNLGLARAGSSCAFAITCIMMGRIISLNGSYSIIIAVFVTSLLNLGVFFFFARFCARKRENVHMETEKHKANAGSLVEFLFKHKRFLLFLGGMTLTFIGHKTLMNFMYQIMVQVGGDSHTQGVAVSISAWAEVPLMALFPLIIKRWKSQKLMALSAIAFSVKILMVALANGPGMIYAAEALQMFSYALYTLSSIYYVKDYIDKEDQAKGQVLVLLPVVLGNIFGNLLGGLWMDAYGVARTNYMMVVLSLIGTCVALYTMREKKQALYEG